MEPTTTQKIIRHLHRHGSIKYPSLLEVNEASLPEDLRPNSPDGNIISLALDTWRNETLECIDFDYGETTHTECVHVLHWFSRDCDFVDQLREQILLAPDSNALLLESGCGEEEIVVQYDANAQYRLLLKCLGYTQEDVFYFIHDKVQVSQVKEEEEEVPRVRVESRPYRAAREVGREYHNTFNTAANLCSPLVRCNGGRVGNNTEDPMDFLEKNGEEEEETKGKESKEKECFAPDFVEEEKKGMEPGEEKKGRRKLQYVPCKVAEGVKVAKDDADVAEAETSKKNWWEKFIFSQAFVVYVALSALVRFVQRTVQEEDYSTKPIQLGSLFMACLALGFFYKKGVMQDGLLALLYLGCVFFFQLDQTILPNFYLVMLLMFCFSIGHDLPSSSKWQKVVKLLIIAGAIVVMCMFCLEKMVDTVYGLLYPLSLFNRSVNGPVSAGTVILALLRDAGGVVMIVSTVSGLCT